MLVAFFVIIITTATVGSVRSLQTSDPRRSIHDEKNIRGGDGNETIARVHTSGPSAPVQEVKNQQATFDNWRGNQLNPNDPCSNASLNVPWKLRGRASDALQLYPQCEKGRPIKTTKTSGCISHSSKILTFAFLYYRDSSFLSAQMKAWCSWPKELRHKVVIMVVDDGSPSASSAFLNYKHDGCFDITFYTVGVDIPWNIGGARNLIFYAAPTEYVFMVDFDTLVPSGIAEISLQLLAQERSRHSKDGVRTIYLNFKRVRAEGSSMRPHPAVMLLSKRAYWMCGGCDEDFVGNYGKTDPHFKWRAARTEKVSVRNVGNISHELVQMSRPNNVTRDASVNGKLFVAKRSGKRRWSNSFLRFPWHHSGDFCS